MDAIEASGTTLAFPTQTTYVALDAARSDTAAVQRSMAAET
jgi:hypothetical protein